MNLSVLTSPARRRLLGATVLFAAAACGASADVVTDWNEIMESTVASSNVFHQTRAAAITQLAVYEAVNSITREYEPYLGTFVAPDEASPEAAAVIAAYRVLTVLYPSSQLGQKRDESLATIPDGVAKANGIAIGMAAADGMLGLRSFDGSNLPMPYTPGTRPGQWQPTPPSHLPATLPRWGRVATFGIRHGAQFRVNPPPALRSGKYAKDLAEVRSVGAVNSPMRPADRTDVARVFAVRTVVNLYHPIARQLSAAEGLTLSQNARLFALVAMAGADALISSMESKYHYNVWRPVTAIQQAAFDGNPATQPDPQWASLIATPAFPSYPSNHATAAAASLTVLRHFFGKSNLNITLPPVDGIVLTYQSFDDIAADIDDARVCGGIHFRYDQEAGSRQGGHVGRYILQHELRRFR